MIPINRASVKAVTNAAAGIGNQPIYAIIMATTTIMNAPTSAFNTLKHPPTKSMRKAGIK